METKRCPKCGDEKELDQFHKVKRSKDGHASYCKPCAVAVAKKAYRDNKDDLLPRMTVYYRNKRKLFRGVIDRIKKQYGCCFCGENEPCCLDFHHIGDDKDKNVSYLTAIRKLDRVISEINKCICVCANCHRKIHAGLIETSHVERCKLTLTEVDEIFKLCS